MMRLPHPLLSVQDRVAAVLGCGASRRPELLAAMLHRGPAEVTGYWAQLLIAAAIATLGLVLGSTAVIIGAMLVAPLMGPIVGLGMGLAAGSTVLVLRSSARVIASLLAVAAISALLTKLLPFHQLNAEIAARTSPTALDLGIAVFCAMAGVFATLRPASDVATTAAGTSIGISLVPPLCVCGYGVGTLAWPVAQGAALLFLTNFAAIVLVASLSFALIGFGQADIARLEAAELDAAPTSLLSRPLARRAMRSVRAFGGPWLRLLMPVALLAALYAPLRRGLDEVAWQITVRGNVDSAISRLPGRVVQAQVQVERGHVQVVIFLLGSQGDALAARDQLLQDIRTSANVVPVVEVFAVPNAQEFEALERSTQVPAVPIVTSPTPVPLAPPPLAQAVDDAAQRVREIVESRWPSSAGELLRVDMDTRTDDGIALRLVHLGEPLGAATLETLVDILSDDLGATVLLSTDDVPAAPIRLDELDDALVMRIATLSERSRGIGELRLCLGVGERPKQPRKDAAREARRKALLDVLARDARLTRLETSEPTLRFALVACDAPAAAPAGK